MSQNGGNLNKGEREFVRLLAEMEMSPVEAAQLALDWPCVTAKEIQKANDKARSPKIRQAVVDRKQDLEAQAEVHLNLNMTQSTDIESIRKQAFDRLCTIRDDPGIKAMTRFQAVKALEKLNNPASDANLVLSWLDYLWRYATVHCPCCHETYPLRKIENEVLDRWREAIDAEPVVETETILERRMELIKRCDPRRTPHPSQITALEAPERHIVGVAPARAGKSYLMGVFAMLGVLLPGVEIWVVAKTYEAAKSEVEYLRQFLKTLFYPHHDLISKTYEDKKNGEISIHTKWGSLIKIRSATSKGLITGRELELALVAEPGWVPADIFNTLRARMSSRLGRILAFGTPKGGGGFIERLVRSTGRDPVTGKIIRLSPEQRTIAAGALWGTSLLYYRLRPEDNPEYVLSELDAARAELTDLEYASEFEGLGVDPEGPKFPRVEDKNLMDVSPEYFARARFVLGIDQGPKNCGVCLMAWDGKTAVACWEYFDNTDNTMKTNLKILRSSVPEWIRALGGNPAAWDLTITDQSPQLHQEFEEFKVVDHRPWPTDIVERHQNNKKVGDNWRRELQSVVNSMADDFDLSTRMYGLMFHLSDLPEEMGDASTAGAHFLHDQFMQCLDKPEQPDKESGAGQDYDKGWIVRDPWRQDHVMDAAYFCLWTIRSGQLMMVENYIVSNSADTYIAQQKELEYRIAADEARDFRKMGVRDVRSDDAIYRSVMGKNAPGQQKPFTGFSRPGYYADES